MMKKLLNNLFITFCILLLGVVLGYGWRMHHEKKIAMHYKSQAEKDIWTLEREFEESWEKPRKFLIFNRRFEVYPVKAERPTYRFTYAGAGDQHKIK